MANIFKNPLGIDISDFKIRVIQIDRNSKNKNRIIGYGDATVPDGYISDGEIKNKTEVTTLIKQCLEKPTFGKFTSKYVNASVSEKKAFLKNITIPNVPANELAGAVRWGIEQNIPVTVDQTYFDWAVLGPDKSARDKLQTIVVVAPKDIIDSYTDCIQNAGLQVLSFENESAAIARCLIPNDIESSPIAIVDLGKSRTTIIIHAHGSVQYTNTIEVNGNAMTKLIAQTLHLNQPDAEKAKIICGLDKTKAKGSIRKILLPIIDNLISKIKENIEYYNSYLTHDATALKKIILTGSVASMEGLGEYIQDPLKLSIQHAQPWINVPLDPRQKKHVVNDANFFSYTTAIGLSLKKNRISSYARS